MNIFQQWQTKRFLASDPWRKARTQHGAGPFYRLGVWLLSQFGKRALPFTSLAGILRENRAIVIDLSSYQPNCNVEALIDAGVQHFFLRMLYIGQYVYDHWNLTEDPTYKPYFDRIRAYAKKTGKQVWIGGYILYTAGVEDQNYAATHIYTDCVGEIMGTAYKPDVLWIDDEVATWLQNNRQTTATDVNQVKGVSELRRKLWERFHIVVGHYSGRWFINRYQAAYTVWFDSINKPGGIEKAMPIWTAWYPVTFSELWTDLWQSLGKLPTPTSAQKIALLDEPGSYSPCDLWQYTGSLIIPQNLNGAGQASGVDASVSLNCLSDFNYALGLTTPVTPPTPPDTGDGDTGDLAEWQKQIADRLTAVEQQQAAIAAAMREAGEKLKGVGA